MRLNEDEINQLVIKKLGKYTKGCTFNHDPRAMIGITLNLPDGDKTTIWGENKHMSNDDRLKSRLAMLKNAIYEQYPEYRETIPKDWKS